MSAFIIALIAVLTVIFLIILLDCLAVRGISYITASCGNDPESVECRLRKILKKNPKSEIIVLDNSHSSEISDILSKMQQDFPEIHIVN